MFTKNSCALECTTFNKGSKFILKKENIGEVNLVNQASIFSFFVNFRKFSID